jgi:N-acetylglucosaminyl-diphospho-decaprenol L-rhamnosyltransferase
VRREATAPIGPGVVMAVSEQASAVRAQRPQVDVVVVSFNSRETLRNSVEGLCKAPDLTVFVVDNASTDGSTETIADLALVLLPRNDNRGFAAGCNEGWRAGAAPYVLFVNPDARIEDSSVRALVARAESDKGIGVVAPRILSADGSLEFSQRRFPALRSTFSQAFFLHRLFRRAEWTDEVIRNRRAYEIAGSPDWVSGACLLVPRNVLESIGGWDESFFLYSEDTDLCRRVRAAGLDIRYEPTAMVVHLGGRSSPRAGLLPLLAESRIRYAEKHATWLGALLQRVGVALSSFSHLLVARRRSTRAGHARALTATLRPRR